MRLFTLLIVTVLAVISCSKETVEIEKDVSLVSIIPGKGVIEMQLNELAGKVIANYGQPTLRASAGGTYQWTYLEPHIGLVFYEVAKESEMEQESIDEIIVQSDYEGTTEAGIGIGSQRDTVIKSYGEPDFINSFFKEDTYTSLKMTFEYSDDFSVKAIRLFK